MAKDIENDERESKWKAPRTDLKEAIERASKIWDKDGRSGSTAESAVQHMGYNKLHGASAMMLADLKKYKLTYYENKRIMFTREALEIFASSDEQKKFAAIRTCALSPELYKELFGRYRHSNQLPSNETVKSDLILDYGFEKDKVGEISAAIRDTFLFAKVFESLPSEPTEFPMGGSELGGKMNQIGVSGDANTKVEQKEFRDFAIPRKAGKIAILRLEYPVKKEDIEQVRKWLDLMGNVIPDESTEE